MPTARRALDKASPLRARGPQITGRPAPSTSQASRGDSACLREASCGKARVMNPGCRQAEVDVLPASASSALRQRLATLPTTSLMVRQQGRLLFSWGDTTIPSYIASIRKSVLSLLMGRHVASGRIRLDATLGDLGIDDVQPLTDIEKTARVRDLLCSRSGVYHPAGQCRRRRPAKTRRKKAGRTIRI